MVHRTGQLEYGFAAEGGAFSVDLVRYLNRSQAGAISTYLYAELFGVRDRLHWFVHMESPHDYQHLLHLVDHDRDYQDISTLDRLPAKGGGNWERMFTPGSFQEHILCPQHGFGHPPDGAVDASRMFTAPAQYQTTQPVDVQLTTASAGAIIVRTGKARYELRDECRIFGVAWAEFVNQALAGDITAFLYEEIFGSQDTLHWLIHLRSLDSYAKLDELSREDPRYLELLDKQWAPDHRYGGNWGQLFVPGSLHDTLLVPYTSSPA
jgi:hypothetical protein